MGALPRVRILGFVSLTSLPLLISVHGALSGRWACGSQCSVGTLPISLLSPPNTHPALGTSVAPKVEMRAHRLCWVLGSTVHPSGMLVSNKKCQCRWAPGCGGLVLQIA